MKDSIIDSLLKYLKIKDDKLDLFKSKNQNKADTSVSLKNYYATRRNWKKMVDKEAHDLYYKQYRKELYLDLYLVTLRYKKPRATWGWMDY